MTEENRTTSDIEQLKSEAVDTRKRLSDDIDAIGAKVSPDNIKREAKAAVSDMGRRAVSEVQSVAHDAATQTQKFSETVVAVVRENPLPAMMVGAGVGWLIYRGATRSRYRSSEYNPSRTGQISQRTKDAFTGARHKLEGAAEDVKHHTQEAAANVQRRAGELSDEARHQARDAGRWVEHSYQESPLLFGAATIGAGMALGLALPRTRVENDLLGEQRDHLVDQMKESAETKARAMEKNVASKAQKYVQKKNGDGSSISGDADRF